MIPTGHIERPPPMEGIWYCERCSRMQPFCTLENLVGRQAPDAPLFCSECDWEMPLRADVVEHFPEPPVERMVMPDPRLKDLIAQCRKDGTLNYRGAAGEAVLKRIEAEQGWRAAGRERWRLFLLSISSPRQAESIVAEIDPNDYARQVELLRGERGRRAS